MTALPENLWTILKTWIEGKKTGSIKLNIKDGNILEVEKTEKIKI